MPAVRTVFLMSGSRRRSGVIDQRDRGRKRHRDLREQAAPSSGEHARPSDYDDFELWLVEYVESVAPEWDDREAERLLAISIKDFLQQSGRFDVPPDERLRLLAIFIEEQRYSLETLERWRAADRLYREAIRLDPNCGVHRTSRALTAHNMLDGANGDQRQAMLQVALDESVAGTELDPTAHAFSVAGQCHYFTDVTAALEFYDAALGIDPKSAWPLLYRAHCLHEFERWEEAAQAYEAVPQHEFVGPKSWRMDRLREQHADCLRRAGSKELARSEFERVLDRYDKEPHLAYRTEMRYVRQACDDWPDFEERIARIEASDGYEPVW